MRADLSARSSPARACSQMRLSSTSQSTSPVASRTSAVRARVSRSRRCSARRPTRVAVSCQPGRSPLRYRAAARPSSRRSRSASGVSPFPTCSACRYSRAASSNASASTATSAADSHAATAGLRSPGHEPATRCRAISVRCSRSAPSNSASIASAAALCSRRWSAALSWAATAWRISSCAKRWSPGRSPATRNPAAAHSSRVGNRLSTGVSSILATTPVENVLPATAAARSSCAALADTWVSR